jgi:hypothetical protein
MTLITGEPGRSPIRHHWVVEPLRLALLRLVIGIQATEDLPAIATDALVRGHDSVTLRELAGTRTTEVRDSRDLFLRAIEELGWTAPADLEARRELARYWAEEMVAGRLEPYPAARLIWWEVWNHVHDENLAIFVGCASEWEDHPKYRPELEQRMMDEARALL